MNVREREGVARQVESAVHNALIVPYACAVKCSKTVTCRCGCCNEDRDHVYHMKRISEPLKAI